MCSLLTQVILQHFETERRGRVLSTPALYWGGVGFESRHGDQLSLLEFFVVFFGPSKRMRE